MLVGTGRKKNKNKPLMNGDVMNGVTNDDDDDDDDDVTYRPVDFCLPVGPVLQFITGQSLCIYSGQ